AQRNAVFGGEHSAHFYFRDFFFADSGMLAAMHVLAALGSQDGTLSELLSTYSPYAASGEINTKVSDVAAATQRVVDAMSEGASTDDFDGVTIDHWDAEPQWWLNVRPSNTEPLLRLNVEAADREVMEQVHDRALEIIREGRVSTEGGTKAAVAALSANLGIAVTRFAACVLAGASSMLDEAIQSVADSGNQVLLLLGGKRARRVATEEHPFGFARTRYLYAFMVAI